MKDISLDSVVKATDRQMSADLAGETVVLNYGDGVYYSLNSVGARIWALLQDSTRVQGILDTLLAEYDTEPEVCKTDLMELLVELQQLGLVEIQDAANP
ncbi:MAG: PqqD family protein [Planctomycetota bacterium]|jgi:hypothetical protein